MNPWIRRALSTSAVAAASLSGLVAFAAPGHAATIDCNAMSAPIYQTINPSVGDQLLTLSSTEYKNSISTYGFTDDRGVLGYGSPTASPGMVPVTRMYNPTTVDFLWVTSDAQISAAKTYGYQVQKVNFYAPTTSSACTVGVHKLSKGDHRRNAVSAADVKALVAAGWADKGILFYVKTGTTTTKAASTATTTTTTTTSSSKAGVPAGTVLRKVSGDIVITTPGTVLENVDLDGYVTVKADNVTIRNSILRGGTAATSAKAIVMSWNGAKNLVVKDSTLIARNPNAWIDGVSGAELTVARLDISHVVDAVKIVGSNVTVKDSVFHDAYHQSSGVTYQSDGTTHNDGVQVEGGSNFVITGNTMSGFANSAIMVTQNIATINGLTINSNTLSGGACTINLAEKGKGPMSGVAITYNKFGAGDRAGFICPIILPLTTQAISTISNNTWLSDGTTATWRKGA